MKFFIYGGSGLVSSKLIEILLSKGHSVIAGSRNPSEQKQEKNLEWVKVEAYEPKEGLNALEKVDAAFLLSPPGYTAQYDILYPLVAKAKELNLKKVVLMTAMGVEFAPPEAPFRKLELALIDSGLHYAILRPNWFMQNFNSFWIEGILKDQNIYFPGGDAVASFIDSRDISATIAEVLTTDRFNNKEFNLTGSEAISHDQVAKLMTDVLGKKINYVDVDPNDFLKSLLSAGLPEDYSNFLLYIAGALREGHASAINENVKKITGKDPILFKNYVKDHKETWIM
ncbi:MAG: NAD(P)H-binding protein [Leptospira sp.]|nr:NAD(P)H-binding protein [Leptospira sp.]NCS93073.1 NAD(P)H-binding protein [Leptospira sp.]